MKMATSCRNLVFNREIQSFYALIVVVSTNLPTSLVFCPASGSVNNAIQHILHDDSALTQQPRKPHLLHWRLYSQKCGFVWLRAENMWRARGAAMGKPAGTLLLSGLPLRFMSNGWVGFADGLLLLTMEMSSDFASPKMAGPSSVLPGRLLAFSLLLPL